MKWYDDPRDDVEMKYKYNIIDAFNSGNVSRLCELVYGLSEQEAQDYILKYKEIYDRTMAKIRASQDTSQEDRESWDLLHSVMDMVDFGRGR